MVPRLASRNDTDEIVNASSGLAVDNSISTSNGTAIDQWQPYGGANQQWVLLAGDAPARQTYLTNASSGQIFGGNLVWDLVPLADGDDLIVQASSGEVLDDPDLRTGASRIDLYQLNGGLNQQWYGAASSVSTDISTTRLATLCSTTRARTRHSSRTSRWAS